MQSCVMQNSNGYFYLVLQFCSDISIVYINLRSLYLSVRKGRILQLCVCLTDNFRQVIKFNGKLFSPSFIFWISNRDHFIRMLMLGYLFSLFFAKIRLDLTKMLKFHENEHTIMRWILCQFYFTAFRQQTHRLIGGWNLTRRLNHGGLWVHWHNHCAKFTQPRILVIYVFHKYDVFCIYIIPLHWHI